MIPDFSDDQFSKITILASAGWTIDFEKAIAIDSHVREHKLEPGSVDELLKQTLKLAGIVIAGYG